jgi:hypothetical protein
MPLDFPSNPTVNEQYVYAGRTWVWNGAAWDSYNPGITAYVSRLNGFTGGITLAEGSNVTISSANNVITISSSASGASSVVTSFNGLTGAVTGVGSFNGSTGTVVFSNYVSSFNGLTGAVTGVTQINAGTGIAITGTTNPTVTNTGVLSVNGSTGAITNVARTNVDNNFSGGQSVTDGINFITYGATEIYFYDDFSSTETILQQPNTGTVQTITLPAGFNTTLAGLAVPQTFTAVNTFSSVANFSAGVSAAGGTFSAITRFTAGITAAGATFTGNIAGTTGSVTFGQSAFTVPVTIRKTYLDNPEVGAEPGTNVENKVPLTISYTTDPTAAASDVLIGLYDATGATYSTRIKTTGIQTGGTVTATSFNGTLNGSINAINGNKITTAVFDTPETADGNPPPVFTFNAATDTDGDFDGLLDETPVLQMGFAGATFSTNVYAPNIVNSVNGLTGALNITGSTGIQISSAGKEITVTNTGVQTFNGDTGSVRLYFPTYNEHETRSGITAQSDYSVFTDFVGNNFSSSIGQGSWLGINANGGSFTISTASITSYGFDKCNGVINFITGTTNNTTGYAGCLLQASHIPGIPTPSNGFVTKYEIECRFMTDTDVTSQDTKTRIGFADTWTNSAPADGVYFERTYDTLLPLTETTFQVVFRNGGAEERINTGVTFAASTIYRTYLCVERDSSGTFTTSWEILNDTTSVTSSGTAAPTNTARYPSASTDYVNPGCVIQKTGSVTTATSRVIRVDYIGTRIRRPLNRSMKLFA